MKSKPILDIRDYHVSLWIQEMMTPVIRGVDLSVNRGEILGILGESGSGKSVLLKTFLGLMKASSYNITSGEVLFDGLSLLDLTLAERTALLGKEIAFIFQNPTQTLSPFKTVSWHFKEVFRIHGLDYKIEKVHEVLKDVGIQNITAVLNMYPYQLSGGMGQRIAIALAVVLNPKLIIADEPTSAIDASLKLKILELLSKINTKYNTSMILVTHDFDVIKRITHQTAVMYGGIVMSYGDTNDLFSKAVHPYTLGLIKCANALKGEAHEIYQLEGYPKSPLAFTAGCPFAERCAYKSSICETVIPKAESFAGGYYRCCNPILEGGFSAK
ncbi:ABC transporter ATP-binding protein [Fusibacter ferrireducens]|uniref:ABC transporter ATP-binding protein n=1 Tax=Fusibacter ferrireducens TaxID=2785058 RepID=A0ABR9ZSQ9_9FIRM|nr:ABC transporter ATP-binding protein [Fusibacter ferrireducens]MBF4693508.1 ABC transporter ATP-binding protein [Fusibacter ferrireducens]